MAFSYKWQIIRNFQTQAQYITETTTTPKIESSLVNYRVRAMNEVFYVRTPNSNRLNILKITERFHTERARTHTFL